MLTRRHVLAGAAALAGIQTFPSALVSAAGTDPEYAELKRRLDAVLDQLRAVPEMPCGDASLRELWYIARMTPDQLAWLVAI